MPVPRIRENEDGVAVGIVWTGLASWIGTIREEVVGVAVAGLTEGPVGRRSLADRAASDLDDDREGRNAPLTEVDADIVESSFAVPGHSREVPRPFIQSHADCAGEQAVGRRHRRHNSVVPGAAGRSLSQGVHHFNVQAGDLRSADVVSHDVSIAFDLLFEVPIFVADHLLDTASVRGQSVPVNACLIPLPLGADVVQGVEDVQRFEFLHRQIEMRIAARSL